MYLDLRMWRVVAALGTAAALPATGSVAAAQSNSGSLKAFGSFSELSHYLKRVVNEQNRLIQEGIRETAKFRRAEALSCKPPERTAGGTLSGYWTGEHKPGIPRHAVVRGRVTDVEGTGLGGAELSLLGSDFTTSSRANGTYELVIPPEGVTTKRSVRLRARHIGFRELAYPVDLGEGDSARVDLRLCSDFYPPVTVTMGMSALTYRHDDSRDVGWTNPKKRETVKLHGDHLVILQRRRLFSVSIRDHELRPVSVVDAFAPGMDSDSTWYGDLLVSHDKIVVLGFNSKYGTSELSTFSIDRQGGLRHLATYQMRQDQGVFFPKYAAQVVGTKLVMYAPVAVPADTSRISKSLPSLRKWHRNAKDSDFHSIAVARRVFRPLRPLMPYDVATLHSLTSCDLIPDELVCTATVVVGPAEFDFYSTHSAVYVWIGYVGDGQTGDEGNTLYRLPLDGSAPRARIIVKPAGTPYTFSEDDNGYLHVLMGPIWPVGPMPPGATIEDVGLLRVSVASFHGEGNSAQAPIYKPLPPWGGARIESRFVGDFILYSNAANSIDLDVEESVLNIMPLSDGAGVTIPLSHPIDLIEDIDKDAVAIGARGHALHFWIISRTDPFRVPSYFVFTNSTDIDFVRQHVNYRPDSPQSGLLAAAVHGPNRSDVDERLYKAPSILFLSRTKSGLSFAGEIAALEPAIMDDGCKGTCDDWYDDSRPLFVRDRIFALLGYELVEAAYESGQVREIRRIGFAPRQ